MPGIGTHPDVYVTEVAAVSQGIPSVNSAVASFEGITIQGPIGVATGVRSFAEYVRIFGGYTANSYLTYAMKNLFDMNGGGLAFVQRIVHFAIVAQVPAGSAVIAMVVTGSPNSATTINLSTPGAIAPIPIGTVIKVGQQIAVVKTASATAPYSNIQQLITLNNPLPLGVPLAGTMVVDGDTSAFRQSAPSQVFMYDSGGAGGVVAPTALYQSIYDGLFYNGLGVATVSNPILTTTTTAIASTAGSNALILTSVTGLRVGESLQIGSGGSAATQEYKIVTGINGTAITLNSPLVNSYAGLISVIAQAFDLTVYSYGQQVEVWKQLSNSSASVKYYVSILNSTLSGSQYINAIDLTSVNSPGNIPANTAANTIQVLSGGLDGIVNPVTSSSIINDTDYIGNATSGTGLQAFNKITDYVLYVGIPGVTSVNVQSNITAYITKRGDAFAVLDSPLGSKPIDMQNLVINNPSIGSDRSALYYPWILVNDPIQGAGQTSTKLVPPSGYVVGAYGRTDKQRGIFKAPAGRSTALLGSLGLEYKATNSDHDLLNPLGVNVIRPFVGIGNVIDGARTLSSASGDLRFNTINVRRSFLQIEKELQLGTRYAVFEPNNIQLWTSLKLQIQQYLLDKYHQQWFGGNSPATSYTIIVDASNNTTNSVAQNIVNINVGIVPSRMAEFINIAISQTDTTSSVTELAPAA